jgi:hypothetical protein
VEGEGLGEDPGEALARVALEAHLPGVEGVGHAEAQPEPLDAQLEPVESRSRSAG